MRERALISLKPHLSAARRPRRRPTTAAHRRRAPNLPSVMPAAAGEPAGATSARLRSTSELDAPIAGAVSAHAGHDAARPGAPRERARAGRRGRCQPAAASACRRRCRAWQRTRLPVDNRSQRLQLGARLLPAARAAREVGGSASARQTKRTCWRQRGSAEPSWRRSTLAVPALQQRGGQRRSRSRQPARDAAHIVRSARRARPRHAAGRRRAPIAPVRAPKTSLPALQAPNPDASALRIATLAGRNAARQRCALLAEAKPLPRQQMPAVNKRRPIHVAGRRNHRHRH